MSPGAVAMRHELPRLYVICDSESASRGCGSLTRAVAQAAAAGARMFQLRMKGATPAEQWRVGAEIAALTAGYGAQLFVNDRADLALALAATGVHRPGHGLPLEALRRLLPNAPIGASCHSLDEARAATEEGCGFLTLSPIFETPSKPGYGPALGLEGLDEVATAVDAPVYALAGVTPERVAECLDAGAHGIAVMGGIIAAADPFAATEAYLEALEG